MSAKRRPVTHVPGNTEIIAAPSSSSRPIKAPSSNATEPVTLEGLAADLEDIKGQIAIMVEWLVVHGERLDMLEDHRPKQN